MDAFAAAGFRPGEVHVANSAGLLFFPELSHVSARPGIALYGYGPAPGRGTVQFEPVLTLKSRISHVHTIPRGETVGYGRTFAAARETRAATIPAGYADGYRRGLSGKAKVIVGGAPVDVIGAVSMDMIVADITDLPGVTEGAEVTLLGASGRFRFDAASWADLLGTIPYEVLCGISPRVPRVYLGQTSE
jgi:alanine racemase